MRILFIVFSITAAIVLSSCESALYRVYGIKKLERFDEELYNKSLQSIVHENHEPYSAIISSVDDFADYHRLYDGLGAKNVKQPIQILYFIGDSLSSFRANCHAKGNMFGKLDWNYDNDFDHTVPMSAIKIPLDTPGLNELCNIYKIPEVESGTFTVVLIWNNMFLKQVRGAIAVIKKNLQDNEQEWDNVKLILINTDKTYVHYFKEE